MVLTFTGLMDLLAVDICSGFASSDLNYEDAKEGGYYY
jgi:hypothetical protein